MLLADLFGLPFFVKSLVKKKTKKRYTNTIDMMNMTNCRHGEESMATFFLSSVLPAYMMLT